MPVWSLSCFYVRKGFPRQGITSALISTHRTLQSVKWCEGLLALPRTAMEITRRQARADLIAQFLREIDPNRANYSIGILVLC